MMEVDLGNRDPNDINSNVKVSFEDVLAEPDGAHSCDCVWKLSYCCFNCGKNCAYRWMTFLCGMCIALSWGCEFACIAFDQIWCVTPTLRIFSIYCGSCQKFFSIVINCCMAPVCETCGLFFSRISVNHGEGGQRC
ncbi:Caveolin-1 [Mizuhopecten yessoensis]|uniref:Caveolin n=1 Tax=Mizuhopecten yessoensis TaxID=6573 RepID=A0A210PEW9_MIZYE|nr:Caveolin-1 [Mizuhopecten yessoensis]